MFGFIKNISKGVKYDNSTRINLMSGIGFGSQRANDFIRFSHNTYDNMCKNTRVEQVYADWAEENKRALVSDFLSNCNY